jgi:hypothetical protein
VISVVDPQARHVHNTVHHRQDGYKAHIAVEPDTGLFTAGELTEASGEDTHEAVVGLALLDNETQTGDLEVLGDSAYGTGDARAALAEAGHTAVIKPAPLRPAVTGGFTLDDFTVDEAAGTVTCLNGLTRALTPARTATFRRRMPFLPATGPMHHRQRRPPHTTTRTRRAATRRRRDWATKPNLRDTYRQHRPMVERSIAWLIGPFYGSSSFRY